MKFLKKIIKLMIIITIIGVIFISGIYLYAKMMPKLDIKQTGSYYLYDQNAELFFQGNGTSEWAKLEEISPYVLNATITIEDKDFYSHHGFDVLRIIKAMYTNIISGSYKQGASTITQQFAKNLYLEFDKTWERKIKELWYTIQLETHYEKDEILEGYLNCINYGHAIYGIENASKFYFNKKASELTLAEASMLVGIPKSPSNYSPLVNLELAKKRQLYILNTMLKEEVITKEEYNLAVGEELTFYGKKDKINLNTLMYYQDAVLDELETMDNIIETYLQKGGIKVYTTLDISAQTSLEESIQENMKDNDEIQVSGIMMDPKTGAVLALVGGRDYNKSRNFSGQVAYEIDQEMRKIMDDCYKKATKIIKDNRDLLDLIANTLITKETLTKEEIDYLVEHKCLPPEEEEPTLEELRNIAKELKIKGYTKMSQEELKNAIENKEIRFSTCII